MMMVDSAAADSPTTGPSNDTDRASIQFAAFPYGAEYDKAQNMTGLLDSGIEATAEE